MTEDVKTEGYTPTPWAVRPAWQDDEECEIFPAWFTPDAGDASEICVVKDWGDNLSEATAHLIVTAVNERSALLRCEEALREVISDRAHMTDEDLRRLLTEDDASSFIKARAALTLLDEARHGK